MTNLYLIRHGHTESVAGDNPKLSNVGKYQAGVLGSRFDRDGINFDEAYTSDMVRATQTGSISLSKIHYNPEKIVVAKSLRELSIREAESQGKEGEEHPTEVMYNWVSDLVLNSRAKKIVLFSHGRAIKYFLRNAFKDDRESLHRINKTSIRHTAITEVLYDGSWNLVKLNDDSHIEQAYIS